MDKPQTSCSQSRLCAKLSVLTASLVAIVCVLVLGANEASAQGLRRQIRAQKKIEKKLERQRGNQNKLAPASGAKSGANASNQPETAAPGATTPQDNNQSLDGIRQRGFRTFFTDEEATLRIPGFGRSPAVLLIIFRQLDLTHEQKEKIRGVRQRVGARLTQTRAELLNLEAQLEEAIYGTNDPASLDNYDPKRVEELTGRVIEKQAEIMRLQIGIESQLRQILTPDQFFAFRELLREMGARRPGAGAPMRQPPAQRRMGVPPNQRIPPEKD